MVRAPSLSLSLSLSFSLSSRTFRTPRGSAHTLAPSILDSSDHWPNNQLATNDRPKSSTSGCDHGDWATRLSNGEGGASVQDPSADCSLLA
ncbi:hypothetical protein BO70DRAFT_26830 [Aspergillus heteromorphus CBS 117.55]|uniref:Uncharacterized protein n=1 Tax=Aspergillus heteromorphus CBS 117.55 TaxID=1448321 RepID=A0A317WC04_9EURO|nr:uncharacterized protein BO70DRAFT_26830 [Aspergillus heteromorphus CBS 117.55]PWY83475.1 hypothetical protein BO70DRAFT_26830 [Aspergillus heteromorphus CBS 117.55]